jgi:3-isopropylmalate dehydrogenase
MHDSLTAQAVPGWEHHCPVAGAATIGVLHGEGIGPEVVQGALAVLEAVGDACTLKYELHVGAPVQRTADDTGALGGATEEFFAVMLEARAPIICGAVGGRFVYEVRARFDLYCKLVPVSPSAVLADASILRPERVHGVDVLIVRDNVGGLYQGAFGRRDDGRTAFQEAVYGADQVDRLLAVAVRAAAARRGRLAVITKPGGIPSVSALWRERADAVPNPSGVTIEEVEVDNACFQLVADPFRFDVVAAPNMLGDVVADTAALVLGSRGMALSANFGETGRAVYQTGHGAAYDLAGTNQANPVAQIQSLAMLLRESLRRPDAAAVVQLAVDNVLGRGLRTPDIAGPASTVVGTRELADAIALEVAQLGTGSMGVAAAGLESADG